MANIIENTKKYIKVVLMNEDRSLSVEIGFFGYTYDGIEQYMTEKFIECNKEYAKRWTQMKYM